MEASFMKRHPIVKDAFGLIIFAACVIIGTILINTFVFRSFSVLGPSMEKTLYTGDRLIVNRLPVTWAQIENKSYEPQRGQIIVFKNPNFDQSTGEEYIVKRVIAFPGERVTVKDGSVLVYNAAHPAGFDPDDAQKNDSGSHPGSPTSGDVDTVVAKGTLFVMGDHRQGNFSCDSRSCMGTIPFYDVVGPVSMRIFPFNKIRFF